MPTTIDGRSLYKFDGRTNAPITWFSRRPAVAASDALHIGLADLVELLAGACDAPVQPGNDRFAVHRVARGATLVHEAAPADTLYVVQAGSFKLVKTAEDGYEHVPGFVWRGDLIGYDGLGDARYAFAAVALEDSRVVAIPFAALADLRRRARVLDSALQVLVARQIAHAGDAAEVMAAVSAEVRLARFLLRLSARMAARGQSQRRLLLRMNRRDIANHLGLAHETISRSLRMLVDEGCLHVDNRDVEILDIERLKQCARNTRGTAAEALQHGMALAQAA